LGERWGADYECSTGDETISASTRWLDYEFKGKPGDPTRRAPQVAPYHLRLDWLMWFEAMTPSPRSGWFFNLLGGLLRGDRETLSLLRTNPFPDAPPRYVRAHIIGTGLRRRPSVARPATGGAGFVRTFHGPVSLARR
jgi:hypothetical protein